MNLDMPPVVGSPIVDVIFEKERILVALEDGRLLAAPPTWAVPKVAAMGPLERSKWVHTSALVMLWRLIADGYNGGLLQFLGNSGGSDRFQVENLDER